jgi:dGTPase
MTIRERIEQAEREYLSPYAALSAESRGRRFPQAPCPVRTAYQRDRDRIIHLCRAFRRLAYKTQVFFAPISDHLRTRLSHTLEVSQIARTIAKALRLNEDLTEAIALAHDVGHTPFGHAGEAALDAAYRRYDRNGRFNHATHSLRVVDELERDGSGLNLTEETRQGIVFHSKGRSDLRDAMARPSGVTLEAVVVRVADRIAYVNHDLDDCLRAGIVTLEDIPADICNVLGRHHSARVGRIVGDLILHSVDSPVLDISDEVAEATDALKDFLYDHVYLSEPLMTEAAKVKGMIRQLFDLYMTSDAALHECVKLVPTDKCARARLVCDYIAGMTDRFARDQYLRHFLPSGYPSFEER